jgi:hypothetical protein
MPQNMTSQPQRRWAIIFWVMLVVTVVAIAGMIYVAMQWKIDDRRQNEWLDQMCVVHGGAYCEHKLPPVTATTAP